MMRQAERPAAEPERSVPAQGLDARQALALVAAVIGLSPYRKVLTPLLGEITRIAFGNRQIGAALAAVAQRSDFRHSGRLRRTQLGAEKAALLAFLEHIRFASPDFLGSVGEWPLGEIRGRG